MPERDKYLNFEELSQHEAEGLDYRINLTHVDAADVAILAPHGGKIEFLTSELAQSIASHVHNYYSFEGVRISHNRELHITSPNFDEPRALELVSRCGRVVTVHGLSGDMMGIQVGGLDVDLRSRIDSSLQSAGFESSVEATGQYGGTHPRNICNRGKARAGVQIEIKAGLRRVLRDDGKQFEAFVNAVRIAIAVR